MANFCSNCGNEIDGAAYCSKCGAKSGSEERKSVTSNKDINMSTVITVGIVLASSLVLFLNWFTMSLPFFGTVSGNCFSLFFRLSEFANGWDVSDDLGGGLFFAFVIFVLACLVVGFSIKTCQDIFNKKTDYVLDVKRTSWISISLSLISIFFVLMMRASLDMGEYSSEAIPMEAPQFILLFIALMGVMVGKRANIAKEENVKSDVLSAYALYLKSVSNPNEYKFTIINIDNEIPQLMLYEKNKEIKNPYTLFTYFENRVVEVGEEKKTDENFRCIEFAYQERGNKVHKRYTDGYGGITDVVYIFTEDGLKRKMVGTNESENEWVVNTVKMSDTDYKKCFEGFSIVDYKTITEMTEENINSII